MSSAVSLFDATNHFRTFVDGQALMVVRSAGEERVRDHEGSEALLRAWKRIATVSAIQKLLRSDASVQALLSELEALADAFKGKSLQVGKLVANTWKRFLTETLPVLVLDAYTTPASPAAPEYAIAA